MENGYELRWYLSVVRRWWWLSLVCTLLAAVSAYAISYWTTPVYSATATLVVDTAQAADGSQYNNILASERLANTYSQMALGRPVLKEVIARLDLRETSEELDERVGVAAVPDTQLIQVSAESTDPDQAALLANTIAEVFVGQIQAQQAERCAQSLAGIQEDMDDLVLLIEEVQAEVDIQRANQIRVETELALLESLLLGQRTDYRALQQDYEELSVAAAQATDKVNVIEAAQVPEDQAQSPYTATVTLLIDRGPGFAGTDSIASERQTNTYSQMLAGRSVLAEARAQLELQATADVLAQQVQAEPVPGTQLIRLSVVDADPAQAVRIANTIAEVFVAEMQIMQQGPYVELLADMQEQMDELEARMEETQAEIDNLIEDKIQAETELARQESTLEDHRSDYRSLQRDYEELRLAAAQSVHSVSVSEMAVAPKSPIRPRTLLNTTLAAAVGLMAGTGVAFLLEYLDDTIRTPGDISQELSLSILGTIDRLAKEDEPLVLVTQPHSPTAEAFRVLATNVRYAGRDRPFRILLVTSPDPAEGKSLVVANLAAALAEAGLRVTAVDADLRHPQLHGLFGLDPQEGITDALLAGSTDGRLQPTQVDRLRILAGGEPTANPKLVGSQSMQKLLQELAQEADLVLIDSPPVLPVADATILASAVDGVLLVLEANRSRRQDAQQAVESLQQVGATAVGVVLNGVSRRRDKYYGGRGKKQAEG